MKFMENKQKFKMNINLVIFVICFYVITAHAHKKKGQLHRYHHLQSTKGKLENASRRSSSTSLGFLKTFTAAENSQLKEFIKRKIEKNIEQNFELKAEKNKDGFFDLKRKVLIHHKKSKAFRNKVKNQQRQSNKHHNKKLKKVKKQQARKNFNDYSDEDDFATDIDIDPNWNLNMKEYNEPEKTPSKPSNYNQIKSNQLQDNKTSVDKSKSKNFNAKQSAVSISENGADAESTTTNNEESGVGSTDSISGSGTEPLKMDKKESYTNKILPQASTNQIQSNSAHSNSAAGQSFPHFPVPPMIPIPLFYNSGDTESSGASGMNEIKASKDVLYGQGESGFGENQMNTQQQQRIKQYESGDWVQNIVDYKQHSHSGEGDAPDEDEEGDDFDEDMEEERLMSQKHHRKSKQKSQQTLNNAQTSPNQPTIYTNKPQQYQQGAYNYQAPQQNQYNAQYNQQYNGNVYSNQEAQAPSQQAYYSPQRYDQSQAYAYQQQQPYAVASQASESAKALASFQEQTAKAWEWAPYASQQVAETGKSASPWTTYQVEPAQPVQPIVGGECASSCSSSCAPLCDYSCCSRAQVASPLKKQGKSDTRKPSVVQQPAVSQLTNTNPSMMQPSTINQESSNLRSQNAQQQQQTFMDQSTYPEQQAYQQPQQTPYAQSNSGFNVQSQSVDVVQSSPEQILNSLPGSQMVTLPDTIIDQGQSTQATSSYYPQQQSDQNAFQQQNNADMTVPRTSVENQSIPESITSVPSSNNQFVEANKPQALTENKDKESNSVELRPSNAPPPASNFKESTNPPAASSTGQDGNRNFALKPVQPIMLKVPSVNVLPDKGDSVRYPSPSCINGCATKCFPFCSNSCCGIDNW